MRRSFCVLALIAVLWPLRGVASDVTVFVAASLGQVTVEIARDFEKRTGVQIVVVAAGTATLARQIDRGAPADIVLSASDAWMQWLGDRGHVVHGDVSVFLGNRLVVIGPHTVDQTEDLSAALGTEGRISVALVEAVPAGQYAKTALQTAGIYPQIAPRFVETDNVRAALQLVRLGEVSRGIVYATDAVSVEDVHVVARVDPALHAPIRYPIARIPRSENVLADRFFEFLRSDAALERFQSFGFLVLEQE